MDPSQLPQIDPVYFCAHSVVWGMTITSLLYWFGWCWSWKILLRPIEQS